MTTTAATALSRGDDRFEDLAAVVRRRVASLAGTPLFRTRHSGLPFGLFGVYLDEFSAPSRQTHNCHACRRFIETYGGLAVIDPDTGTHRSALWSGTDNLPAEYAPSVHALAAVVRSALIDGVFLRGESNWGAGPTRDGKRGVTWEHFYAPAAARFAHPILTAGQAMAERHEEYGMLQRGLADFSIDTVRQAKGLLETDALYRSEKVLGVATWLLDLHEKREATQNHRTRENLTWLAVATAPPGFAHVRSTMIGTLLEDIAAGLPFEDVKRKFAAKMHPLQYLRPQAPPSAGNIAAAEKIVATLRTAGSLERRFARLSDLRPLWTPRAVERPATVQAGVFGHLRQAVSRAAEKLMAPAAVMTWEKFARTVLVTAERIECLVPSGSSAFVALVTSANPDAPPVLQWDRDDERNPVSWYFYAGGAMARDFNLEAGSWCPVTAVTLSPAKWGAHPLTHHADMAIFVLAGAKDMRHRQGGGFFPEQLRSEYHGIRRTLEAYVLGAAIAGRDESEGCGIALQKGAQPWTTTFRVTAKGMQTLYRPDRWD